MKIRSRFALFSAAAALILTVAFRASPTAQSAEANRTTRLPDNPRTALYVRVCAHCHDLERIESRHRTKAEWLGTIQQMIDDGAEASDEEFETVVDVLVRNFGAVAINRAPAGDLVTVLDITARDADAIVAYRTAKGTFADFDALRNVPDIDMAKLEQRKAAIRF
jgi:DNA uptake protein ComE-like DNA-binding protein